MSLTQCPDCRQLCFLAAASCQGCGQAFQQDALRARAAAEEKSFQRKAGILFSVVLLTLLSVLLFVVMREHMKVFGLFQGVAGLVAG